MNDLIRLDSHEAATYARCHYITVMKALNSGELHGAQRKARGKWSIRRECLEAWVEGQQCPHLERRAS